MTSIQELPSVEEMRSQQTIPTPIPETQETFDWRNCWYPVAFVQDLPKNRPYTFSLYDEPYVLFRSKEGKLGCVTDRCPHRAAKLSDGQIIDGKLECLYHGWQFGIDGECLHVPQLASDAKIPKNACVRSFKLVERQGIIWMWAGEAENANEEKIPTIADLEKPEFVTTDYICDLPYDQNYFIENVIDPAHVYISHDGTESNRNNAQPLEIQIIESSIKGIKGKWRETRTAEARWYDINFIAPNLIHYRFTIEKRGWTAGLALYSIPLTQQRSRLLLRRYRNFFTGKKKLVPTFIEHLRQNKILEQDLSQVVGQKAEIERMGRSLKEVFLPLKTSDPLVIEYRKWLDKFGVSLPFYQGYETAKLTANSRECHQAPVLLDRLSRHTQMCSSCNRAYQVTNKLKQGAIGVAIAFAAL